METRTLEIEVLPQPRREEFGEGMDADRRFHLHYRRWRAEVSSRINAQMPAGFGLFKWRAEERAGQWIAVAEVVGESD
jgi:hypothetical protein